MQGRRFQPSGGPDRDHRVLSDEQLKQAEKDGKTK
jgi:hypothetical protein